MKNTRYLLKDFLMHLNPTQYIMVFQKDKTGAYNNCIHNGSAEKYLNNPLNKDYFIDTIVCQFSGFVIYV